MKPPTINVNKPNPSQLLIALGATVVALWAWQVVRMKNAGMLDSSPNVAALGGSPYGRTLAMVMQGPVDAYWHGGAESGHVHGPECDHDHDEAEIGAGGEPPAEGLVGHAKEMIEHLGNAIREPNTPYGQSQAHVRYLRRQIERKLETAYWLDPGNYANFNALALFLSEAAVATRGVSPQRLLYFADHTIAHVEKNELVNPEPWLTAASAVHVKIEILQRMADSRGDSRAEMEQLLARYEHCLARYAFLRDIQIASKRWTAISPVRRAAMDDRANMLNKLLEAQTAILKRSAEEPATR